MAAMNEDKEQLMEQLFLTTVRTLTAKIKSGDATPQDFKNAIQFLKDNGIDCTAKRGPDYLMRELLEELPLDEEMN